MAILKIRDENGKFIEIPSIKGEKGDKGDTGYTLTNTVSGENVTINDALEEKISSLEIDGKSVQNGTPTPDTPVEIESVGYENLFDSENWYETLNTIKSESIQKEIVNGIEYYKFRADAIYDYQYMKGQFKENTQYIITAKARQYDIADQTSTGFVIYYTDGTKNYQYVNRTLEEYDYTLISEINKTIDFISLGYAYNNYVLMRNIMMVEGTEEKSYIPYGKYGIELEITNGTDTNTSVIALNEPLRSLPNGVKDTYENGVVTRRIGKVVLNGSESWKDNYFVSDGYFYVNITGKAKGYDNFIISHFKATRTVVADSNTAIGTKTGNAMSFFPDDNTANSLEEWKTWLSNNNVEVIYELATPTTETVEMPVINTFEGTNNIDVNGGISTTFNVTYTQDIRKIVDEYTTEEEVQNLINEALGIINTELASLTEVSE